MADTCPTCGGKGTVENYCSHCKGTGSEYKDRQPFPCRECGGTGRPKQPAEA